MIRGYPGWSGYHKKTHNGHFWGWEYIYPFTSFIYCSLSLSPTNHTSLAFIPSLLFILELDSCKKTPRDWEEVRFEVWFESTLWASTCSSQESLDTTTDYLIANAPSPPVYFEPAVIVYDRRFQMDPAVMLTYHRRFVLRTGGDMLASPSGPFGTGSDRLSPPVRNKLAVMGRLRWCIL